MYSCLYISAASMDPCRVTLQATFKNLSLRTPEIRISTDPCAQYILTRPVVTDPDGVSVEHRHFGRSTFWFSASNSGYPCGPPAAVCILTRLAVIVPGGVNADHRSLEVPLCAIPGLLLLLLPGWKWLHATIRNNRQQR